MLTIAQNNFDRNKVDFRGSGSMLFSIGMRLPPAENGVSKLLGHDWKSLAEIL
jgi:hypothetical protein